MRATARTLRVGLAVLNTVSLVCTIFGVLYMALPARDSEYASFIRLTLSYSLLRKGMPLKNVERIMDRYYVVNGLDFPRLMSYYQRKKNNPLETPPTARPLPENYSGALWYLHDVAHGNHNSDFVRLGFKDGILTDKSMIRD